MNVKKWKEKNAKYGISLYWFTIWRDHENCKGEDLIRESGMPYAIVRPCALTEEPAGADLIFEQGDNITVKMYI